MNNGGEIVEVGGGALLRRAWLDRGSNGPLVEWEERFTSFVIDNSYDNLFPR